MDSIALLPPSATSPDAAPALPAPRRRYPLAAALTLALLCSQGLANGNGHEPAAAAAAAASEPPAGLQDSGMRGELFYQLLVSELQVSQGQPGIGFSLLLETARKHKRAELFRRAIEIALQARSGESALQAAKAWADVEPRSVQAQRFMLQILIAINRPAEMAAPLRSLLRLTPAEQRQDLIVGLPQLLARLTDREAVLKAAKPMLLDASREAPLAAPAWSSLGRFELAAGQKPAALESARKAMAADSKSALPAWLVLMLLEQKQEGAETLVQRWLAQDKVAVADSQRIRLEYARLLTDQQRRDEAGRQLAIITRDNPGVAEPWLLQGLLALQSGQPDQATTALERYLSLQPSNSRGTMQARILLSEAAEKQGRLDLALTWLEQVEDAEALPAVLSRRALLMARQGRLPEARALLRQMPGQTDADERRKLIAEGQLLRDLALYPEALEVYAEAMNRFPQDSDIAYERAMVAEKAGRLDEMEQWLRELIARAPDYGHAYNALGYSLADRKLKLQEARELIQRALQLLPDDPFVQDSMGWVEFRLGHLAESRRWLELAFERRPDAEIAAHLGEVLWELGEQDAARKVWQRGQQQQPGNETLQRTLDRLQVRP